MAADAIVREGERGVNPARPAPARVDEHPAASGSPETAAAAVGRELLQATGAPHAAVFLRAPSGTVTCPWSHNLSRDYVGELITPSGVNPWAHLSRHPELECMDLPKGGQRRAAVPRHLEDLRKMLYRETIAKRIAREGLRSISSWPLVRHGRVIGAIVCCYDTPRVCSAEDDETMRAFAARAAEMLSTGTASRLPESPTAGQGPTAGAARCADHGRTVRPETIDRGVPRGASRLAALERDLAAQDERLAARRASLEAEYRRLAAEAARVTAERQALVAERARLVAARAD